MFSVRMSRHCAFCGSTKRIEGEHVWPDWASKHFADEGTFTYYRQFIGEGYEPETPSSWLQEAFHWRVKAVCKTCNNGWMSDLEGAAKDALFEAAFDMRDRLLSRDAQRTLAVWALKTAMMAEHTNGASRRGIPLAEYEQVWEHREPSSSVRIWLASYIGARAVALALPFGLDVGVDRLPSRERGERNVWGSTILFGRVVFQIVGSNVGNVLDAFDLVAPNIHQIWPYREPFTWTPSPGLPDAAVIQLHHEYLAKLKAVLAQQAH